MAIKRRPTDEDDDFDDEDEDRPRGKRRPASESQLSKSRRSRDDDDEDEDDEEAEDRPARKRSARDEDDEEEDERPRRRKSRDEEDDEDEKPRSKRRSRDEKDDDRDDEEEEDKPPRSKRRSRDEEEDEEDDEDRPRGKKKHDDEEDVEETEEDDEERDEDEEEDGDEDEEDDEEKDDDEYDRWQRKQNEKRQYLIGALDGLKLFKKRAMIYLVSLVGVIAAVGVFFLFRWLVKDQLILAQMPLILAGLIHGVLVPVLGMNAAIQSKKGPPKIATSGLLTVIIVMNVLLIVATATHLIYFIEENILIPIIAFAVLALFYVVALVFDLAFLAAFADYLKDRPSANRSKTTITHLLLTFFIATPILALAIFFLMKMAGVGPVLSAALAGIWVTLYIKVFLGISNIAETLCITINKKVARIDKPNW